MEELGVEKQRFQSTKLLFGKIDQASAPDYTIHNATINSHNSSMRETQIRKQEQKQRTNLNIWNELRREEEFDQASRNVAGINQVIGQMGEQVYIQGGIIDRIDYNM